MKKAWLFLADRFDARAPRERLFLFLGVVAALCGFVYFVSIDPALRAYRQANDALQQDEKMLASFDAQEVAQVEAANRDPDAETRKAINDLTRDNARLRDELAATRTELASPEQMTGVLRELIAGQRNLELAGIHALPPEDLLKPAADASAPAATGGEGRSIYRHGIEVTVRGEYPALVEYLRKVEALPWKVQLGGLVLQTEHYPVSKLRITFNTLSLERAWLAF